MKGRSPEVKQTVGLFGFGVDVLVLPTVCRAGVGSTKDCTCSESNLNAGKRNLQNWPTGAT